MAVQSHLAIRQLKHDYCFAIDGGDYEKWVSLFTADGRLVLDGEDTFEGHEELHTFATEMFESAYEHTAHVVSNPVITVNDDSATGRWYLLLAYRDAEGNEGWRQARYDDEYRNVDGTWRIAESRTTSGVSLE